jgi:predicted DNA-binding protein (MmcQ/YjbR family)
MKGSSVLDHMRAICLALPDTKETLTWGQPHFRVGEKIFAGCGEEKGRVVIGFKLDMDHADAIIQDPRFWRAPYVGHKGWVSMAAGGVDDWDEVRPLVLESYRLIAPRRTVAKLDGGAAPAKKGLQKAAKGAAPKTARKTARTATKSSRGRRA